MIILYYSFEKVGQKTTIALTQLIAQIKQIINDPVQFKEQYSSITNSLILQLNTTIKGYVKNAKRSILKDINDIIISQIDFEALKNQLGI